MRLSHQIYYSGIRKDNKWQSAISCSSSWKALYILGWKHMCICNCFIFLWMPLDAKWLKRFRHKKRHVLMVSCGLRYQEANGQGSETCPSSFVCSLTGGEVVYCTHHSSSLVPSSSSSLFSHTHYPAVLLYHAFFFVILANPPHDHSFTQVMYCVWPQKKQSFDRRKCDQAGDRNDDTEKG